jgi:hypothetical protein
VDRVVVTSDDSALHEASPRWLLPARRR